jgi:hypothetical protein
MSWTGARSRYVVKYTAKYAAMFPSSRIIVVATSPGDFCFRSSKQKQRRMKCLVENLVRYGESGQLRLLIHAFSEGGSNKAVELAEAYYGYCGRRLPAVALCLDSTPGQPCFRRLCNALSKSLPQHPLSKHTGLAVGAVVLGGMWFYYCVFRTYNDNPISKTRRQLLNPDRFDPSAPRCYLYSRSDPLVAWKDVRSHIQASVDQGVPATEVIFDETDHCMHAREEPLLYWGAIQQTWDKTRYTDKAANCNFGGKDRMLVPGVFVDDVEKMAL